MKCLRIGGAFLCGNFAESKTCVGCGAAASLLCDWKLGKPVDEVGMRKGPPTCDASICEKCAQQVGPDKHLCPKHQAVYKAWMEERHKLQGHTPQGPGA